MSDALLHFVGVIVVGAVLLAIWIVLDRVVAPLLLIARRRRHVARASNDAERLAAIDALYTDKPDGPRALALRFARVLPWIIGYAGVSALFSVLWRGVA